MVHVSDVGQLGALVTKSMQAQVIQSAKNIARRQAGHATAGLPQSVINSPGALKQRAGVSAAKAKQAATNSKLLQQDAQKQADAARAALQRGDKQKAGTHIVKHLTDMREAYKNEAAAVKNKRIATAQAQAANIAAQATKIREAANTAIATGNTVAAAQLTARAEIAERQKVLATQAAEVIAATPLNIPVPAELTEQAIVSAASRYTVRVARRDGAHLQHDRALLAVLGDMDTRDAGFRNPAAILAEYGGGPVGLVFAGAEMGNLGMYNRGMGSLGNWFTDGLKEIGKGVGLDVDAIEKGFNDAGSVIGGALKEGEKLVKGVTSVISPPKPAVNLPSNTGASTIKQNVNAPPPVPQVKSPTGAPSIKIDSTSTARVPDMPQDIRKVTGTSSMSMGKKAAIGVGLLALLVGGYSYASR